MRDIELGGRYRVYGQDQPLIARSIEKADRKNGIWDTRIICSDPVSGDEVKHYPANLTPWEEHLQNKRLEKLEQQATLENAQAIIETMGGGATIDAHGPRYARLWFTEEAAEKALGLLGAKSLPDDRRPSRVEDEHSEEWQRLCVLLGRRLKRAFGAGYAGSWLSDNLSPPYVAELYFYDNIEQAALKITGQVGETRSELADLFA